MRLRLSWLWTAGLVALAVIAALSAGLARRVAFDLRHGRGQHAFDPLIWDAATRHDVSPFLVKAVITRESRFRPLARGGKGEIGLMQITDGAVKDWSRETGNPVPQRGLLFDPRMNIEIGTWYLARAMKRWRDYRDGEVLALAQYNAGGSNAARWAPDDPAGGMAIERIGFSSTRDYIVFVKQAWRHYEKEHQHRQRQ